MNENKFLDIFKINNDDIYFSPGRVNLIGEHIDYNGGNVLPIAINFGTYGYVRKREDKIIKLYSLNFPEVGIIKLDLDQKEYAKDNLWSDYVKGVILEFEKKGKNINSGFDILIYGTIPNSSGLSSSASLEILIAKIINDYNNFKLSDIDLAIIGQKAENNFVGVNCGIMDQFIIATAKQNYASLINTDKLTYDLINADFQNNNLIVFNSKKKRGLVDSKYNDRRQSCMNVLKIAKEKFSINNLCELTIDQLATLNISENDRKKATHVILENIRVNESVKYLKSGDLLSFGKKLNESHESLKNLYEVSCKEIDYLVDLCMEYGAIGARMTGAGFGGCTIGLFPKGNEHILEQIKIEYDKKFNLNMKYYIVNSSNKTGKIKE